VILSIRSSGCHGATPARPAAREACDEADLVGRIAKKPIGTYSYEKCTRTGALVPCDVLIFPLAVRKRHKRWPEMMERDSRWFSPDGASSAMCKKGLRAILSFEPFAPAETAPALEAPEEIRP
jgi:hypothetical protein